MEESKGVREGEGRREEGGVEGGRASIGPENDVNESVSPVNASMSPTSRT